MCSNSERIDSRCEVVSACENRMIGRSWYRSCLRIWYLRVVPSLFKPPQTLCIVYSYNGRLPSRDRPER